MIRHAIRFALIAAATAALAAPAFGEVHWADGSYQDILESAKKETKNIFLDFYAVWCGPCQMLEKVTYKDDTVEAFLNGIIAAKYDAEKGEGKTLAGRFKVVAYPTLVVLDADGNEIDRHLGYIDPDGFMKTIKGYTEGVGTVAYYEKKLAGDPNNLDLLLTLGMKHADASRTEKAKATLGRLLALDPDNKHGHVAEVLYSLGDACYGAEQDREAESYFSMLADRFPDGEWYDRAQTQLARVYFRMDDHEKSLAAYRKYVARHAEDPRALNGFAWFCAQRKFGFDAALPAALKAVELSGREAGVLDTLAELYYAMGENDKALEIGEEALSKQPDDTYFKEQVVKFKKARDEAREQAKR